MNNYLTNRNSMVNTVITFCDANTSATSGIPSFATNLAAIKAKMVLVNGFNQIGNGSTKGITQDTILLRKTMTDLAFVCARATMGFANFTNNNPLKALVDYTITDLENLKKDDVDDDCQKIHDAANANVADVVNYGITATDITDLQSAIDLYRAATQNPRFAIIQRSQAKKQVAKLLKEVVEELLVGQADVMADTLMISNNLFWSGYKQARDVINLGSTTAKIRGTVTIAKEGTFLANVKFTIYEAGTLNVVKQVISNAEGKFNASKLPAGDYDFKWELAGYKTVREAGIHLSAGKEIRRKITLKPAGGTLVKEGDVAPGAIMNINVNNIHADLDSTVKMEVTGGPLWFYVSDTIGAEPGDVYVEFQNGDIREETIQQFAHELGFEESDDDQFLNVKNVGTGSGHYKMTIKGLQQ